MANLAGFIILNIILFIEFFFKTRKMRFAFEKGVNDITVTLILILALCLVTNLHLFISQNDDANNSWFKFQAVINQHDHFWA